MVLCIFFNIEYMLTAHSFQTLLVIRSSLLNGRLGPAVVPYWLEISREGSQYGLSLVK